MHLQDATGQNLERFGAAVSELQDQNGDGRWELLIGAPSYDGDGLDDGRVYLWFGSTELSLSPNMTLQGQNGEFFGFAVARVGDVNDDGFDDFAVGAPLASGLGENNGRVYLFFGGPGLDATADRILEGPFTGGQFGFSVSAAGDFDGDDVDDLIVGAPYTDSVGLDAGAAYLYYGRSGGPNTVPDLTLNGEIAGDLFGWSVCDAGRFYAGNEDCVLVGAPLNNTHGGLDGGAVYVYRGTTGLPAPDAVADLVLGNSGSTPAGSQYGYSVRGIGDWSGDGRDDIAVGAPFDDSGGIDAGRIEIHFGSSSPGTSADRFVNGQDGEDHFGWSLADVTDVAGSGLADLLIGAPTQAADGINSGRAYLYLGGDSSHSDASALMVLQVSGIRPGTSPEDRYGYAVSSAGDFDGDGKADYAVGASRGNNGSNVETGYVHVVDSSDTATGALLTHWRAVWTAGAGVRLELGLAASPQSLSHLLVERWVFLAGRPAAERIAVYSGASLPDDSASGGFHREGDLWVFADDPGPLAPDAVLAYDVTITMQDGERIVLGRLAGPARLVPVLRPELLPAHPNPFNPRTVLSFRAPGGQPTVCRIVDLRGRHVALLFRGSASGYWQEVMWDGRAEGRPASAGPYLVQVTAGGQTACQRITLAK